MLPAIFGLFCFDLIEAKSKALQKPTPFYQMCWSLWYQPSFCQADNPVSPLLLLFVRVPHETLFFSDRLSFPIQPKKLAHSAQNVPLASRLVLFLLQKFPVGQQHQGRCSRCREQPHTTHHIHQRHHRPTPCTPPPPPALPPPRLLRTGSKTQTNLVPLQGWQTLQEQTIAS